MYIKKTLEQAQQDVKTAKVLYEKQEYKQAISLLEGAMKVLESLPRELGEKEEWEVYMEAVCELSKLYRIDSCFHEMNHLLIHAIKIYTQKCPNLIVYKVRLYLEKGLGLESMDRYEEAIDCHMNTQKIIEKKGIGGNLLICTLLRQVRCFTKLSRFSRAQQLLERISELLNKEENKDDVLIAKYYEEKGEVNFHRTNYKAAKKDYEKAYSLYPPNASYQRAVIYCRIAGIYGFLGNKKKEIEYYTNMKKVQYSPVVKRDKTLVAYICGRMARYFRDTGDLEQAIYYHENALRLVEEVNGKNSSNFASILTNLSNTYGKQKNYYKQIEYAEQALAIFKNIYGEADRRCAIVFSNLANSYTLLGKIDIALPYFQKALRIYIDILGETHELTLIAYLNLTIALEEKKNFSGALKYLEKVQTITQNNQGNTQKIRGISYASTGFIFYQQGKFEQALKQYQLALMIFLPNYQSTNLYDLPNVEECIFLDSVDFLKLLSNQARTAYSYFQFLESSQSMEAFHALRASLDICQFITDYIQEIQKNIRVENSKLNFIETMPSIYQLSIKVVLTLADYLGDNAILERAFAFKEFATAFLLRASMQENEAKLQADIDSNLLQQEKDLKNQIETYLQQIQKEEAKGKYKNENLLKEWKQKHFDILQSHQKIIEQLEEEYPQYYQLKYDMKIISITELQAELDEYTVVVSYFVGTQMGYIFAITEDEYEITSFDISSIPPSKPSNFDQQIQDYLNAIHAQNLADFTRLSQELYELLIKPISYLIYDPFMESPKKLVILPSGSLHYLPFETFVREVPVAANFGFHQLDYLIHHCQIQYHYSATLYHQSLTQSSAHLPPIRKSGVIDFLGFAPIYTSDKGATQEVLRGLVKDYSRWATRSDALQNGELAPLPFSEQEVENIEALFTQKGLKGQSLLYNTATKDYFKSFASNAKYLHIAAHGLTNDEYPKLSGIVFHPNEESGEIYDSVLSMGEMYQLQLQADLVVLSSCESGIGKLAKGEGMMAINRGFLYAGAKNVIFTLFKVLDKPSSELCEALFAEILEGKTYTEALRLAKLRLIQREEVDPKSWSGFVLLGA